MGVLASNLLTAVINIPNALNDTVVDDWLANNPSAIVHFVSKFGSSSIIIFYQEGGNMASVIYVDPKSGNDSDSGSFAAPKLTLTAALAAISDNASNKPYLIKAFPGTFTDSSAITWKPFVSFEGSGIGNTVINRSISLFCTASCDIEFRNCSSSSTIDISADNNLNVNLILRECDFTSITFTPPAIGDLEHSQLYIYGGVTRDVILNAPSDSKIFGSNMLGGIALGDSSTLTISGGSAGSFSNYMTISIGDGSVVTVVGLAPRPVGNTNYIVNPTNASPGTTPEIRYDPASTPGGYANAHPITKTAL